jgi:hypothetical protein
MSVGWEELSIHALIGREMPGVPPQEVLDI